LKYNIIRDGWIKIPADSFPLDSGEINGNRLLIGLNQLFIRISGKNILIDAGLGNKCDFTDLGLLDYQKPRELLHELSKIGIKPNDIDIVLLTHLHYDHAGGCTFLDAGKLAPTFTNALYYIQERELEYARSLDSPDRCGYYPDDYEPLTASGRLVMLDGDSEVIPGLSVGLAPGHSPGHQVVIIQSGSETVFFSGDLFSVVEHTNLEVVTEHDLDTKELLKARRKWIALAHENRWECIFCHAVRDVMSTI